MELKGPPLLNITTALMAILRQMKEEIDNARAGVPAQVRFFVVLDVRFVHEETRTEMEETLQLEF